MNYDNMRDHQKHPKKYVIAPGGSGTLCFYPRRPGILPVTITLIRLMKISSRKKGVRGMLPAWCLLFQGSEGGTLIPAAESNRVMGKKDLSGALFFIRRQ
jgi:hypothetical protein